MKDAGDGNGESGTMNLARIGRELSLMELSEW